MEERERIRSRLRANGLPVTWLIRMLAKRDIETTRSAMSRVFAGDWKGPRAERIISESCDILDRYEERIGDAL